MTRPASYLGIDLGTSGLKVALVREDGELVAEGEAAYQVQAPRTGDVVKVSPLAGRNLVGAARP